MHQEEEILEAQVAEETPVAARPLQLLQWPRHPWGKTRTRGTCTEAKAMCKNRDVRALYGSTQVDATAVRSTGTHLHHTQWNFLNFSLQKAWH